MPLDDCPVGAACGSRTRISRFGRPAPCCYDQRRSVSGVRTGFDPCLAVPRTAVLPLHYTHHRNGQGSWIRTSARSVQGSAMCPDSLTPCWSSARESNPDFTVIGRASCRLNEQTSCWLRRRDSNPRHRRMRPCWGRLQSTPHELARAVALASTGLCFGGSATPMGSPTRKWLAAQDSNLPRSRLTAGRLHPEDQRPMKCAKRLRLGSTAYGDLAGQALEIRGGAKSPRTSNAGRASRCGSRSRRYRACRRRYRSRCRTRRRS